jgi:hypothetical protein
LIESSKKDKETWSKEEKRYFKLHGRLPGASPEANDEENTATTEAPITGDHKITVLCVRFGNKYGIEYVERLRNMVARNLTVPYEFVCLTDDHTRINGVRILYQRAAGYTRLWWHKVHMFDPNLNVSGRILYFDLDVVILRNIDKLVQISGNRFMGIQDFNRKFHPNWKMLNSSVLSWEHRSQSDIWEKFSKDPRHAQRLHGDQDWIWAVSKEKIKFWPQEWIQSYKWEIRSREELINRTGKYGFKDVKNVVPHPDCSVAVFHGDPKPENITDQLIIDNWQ